MNRIIKNLKLILQGSFVSYLRNYLLAIYNLKDISNVDFSNIENYFKNNKKEGFSDKCVLVELLYEHPTVNNNNYIVNLLIGHKYSTNVIGLIKYRSCVDIKKIAKKYNIKNFVYVYTYRNIVYRLKAMLSLIRCFRQLCYNQKFGWNISVDGVEIGDLIYDQYLRYTNFPTVRKINFNYIIYILNSFFYFHRYKNILVENNISDIVISHGVYAEYGILNRVAASLNKDINIYQWFNLNPMNISVHKANEKYIRKPRYYESCLMESIIAHYGKGMIISEYSKFMDTRLKGDDKNQIDLAFVYRGNEINSCEEFRKYYKIQDGSKNIFIFSHAFVDSVKYSHWSLFSDYYTWLYETLVILAEKSRMMNIFIKPHPSESMYKCEVTVQSTISEINKKFDANFIFLDKKTYNKVIFDLADSIITSNGTVAIEAVCYGIPVLVSASTLYENANTVIQPKTVGEYNYYLHNIESLTKPSEEVIERAKLCFMFYQKYVYVPASFLRNGHVFGTANRFEEYTEHNLMFNTDVKLENEPLYKAFLSMIENNEHDTIYLN